MASRTKYLNINRKSHGILWWVIVGWWERPISTILWLLLSQILGFKGVKFYYHK